MGKTLEAWQEVHLPALLQVGVFSFLLMGIFKDFYLEL